MSEQVVPQALFQSWWFRTDGPLPWSRKLAEHCCTIPLGIRKPRMLNQFTISAENSHSNSNSDTSIANHCAE